MIFLWRFVINAADYNTECPFTQLFKDLISIVYLISSLIKKVTIITIETIIIYLGCLVICSQDLRINWWISKCSSSRLQIHIVDNFESFYLILLKWSQALGENSTSINATHWELELLHRLLWSFATWRSYNGFLMVQSTRFVYGLGVVVFINRPWMCRLPLLVLHEASPYCLFFW